MGEEKDGGREEEVSSCMWKELRCGRFDAVVRLCATRSGACHVKLVGDAKVRPRLLMVEQRM